MILSNKRIIKALIRLRGCAGWSEPLLFANPEDRFSRAEAHIRWLILYTNSPIVCETIEEINNNKRKQQKQTKSKYYLAPLKLNSQAARLV